MKAGLNKLEIANKIVAITKAKDMSQKDFLLQNKKNNDSFWNNYLISDLAISGLDIIGAEKYKGDRREIKDLIASGFDFD